MTFSSVQLTLSNAIGHSCQGKTQQLNGHVLQCSPSLTTQLHVQIVVLVTHAYILHQTVKNKCSISQIAPFQFCYFQFLDPFHSGAATSKLYSATSIMLHFTADRDFLGLGTGLVPRIAHWDLCWFNWSWFYI